MHEAARAGRRCAGRRAGTDITLHRTIAGPGGTANRCAFGGAFGGVTAATATLGAGLVRQCRAVFNVFVRATGAHLLVMIVWVKNRAL